MHAFGFVECWPFGDKRNGPESGIIRFQPTLVTEEHLTVVGGASEEDVVSNCQTVTPRLQQLTDFLNIKIQ